MRQTFRFLHAGDFLLGAPLTGVGQQSSALAESLRDAPYDAVERLVGSALSHRVAFVVLVGDLWCPGAGPGPADFLRQQFQRLADRDVPVFWAAGRQHAQETWSSAIKFPANLHRFASEPSPPIAIRHKKIELAQITGQSWERHQTFSADISESVRDFSVVACCSARVPAGWASSDAHYWAVGGSEKRRTRQMAGRILHSSGMPQARHSNQTGPHGATLVTVQDSRARLKPIAVDSLRWQNETLILSDNADLDSLRRLMLDRMRQIQRGHFRLLVRWHVTAPGDLGAQLRHGGLDQKCLELHSADLAAEELPVVPLSIETAYREFRPEWLDEDTLLSEFLQVIRDFRERNTDFQYSNYLPEDSLPSNLVDALTSQDDEQRSQVLRDAAALGVDLLTGDVDLNAFEAAWGKP